MTETKCPKCGHVWNYKGKLMKRTCTNCSYSWIVKEAIEEKLNRKQ